MTLPSLSFTPQEAAAVALSRSEHVIWARDARSALNKIVAAIPERSVREARSTAETVRLLVQPVPGLAAEIAEVIWRAVRQNEVLRICSIDAGRIETTREIAYLRDPAGNLFGVFSPPAA